jgi:hypothetical protein
MHAHQRWPGADLEIGHVVSVDVKRLHQGARGGAKGLGAMEWRCDDPRSSELVYAVKFPQVSGG